MAASLPALEATEARRTGQVHLPHPARCEMTQNLIPPDTLNPKHDGPSGSAATNAIAAVPDAPAHEPDRTPPTAAEMVERRVEMLTVRLTLDAAQQAQGIHSVTDSRYGGSLETAVEAQEPGIGALNDRSLFEGGG